PLAHIARKRIGLASCFAFRRELHSQPHRLGTALPSIVCQRRLPIPRLKSKANAMLNLTISIVAGVVSLMSGASYVFWRGEETHKVRLPLAVFCAGWGL